MEFFPVSGSIDSILALAGRVRISGASLQMLDLLSGLHARGCRVVLLCRRLPAELDCRHITFPVAQRAGSGASRAAFRDPDFFQRHYHHAPPQLVHVYGARLGWGARALVKSLGRPVVFTPGSTDDDVGDVMRIQRWASGVIAFNQSMREALVNRIHVPRDKVTVVSPGVDLARCDVVAPQAAGRVPVVGMAGPFRKNGGQRLFLDAARRVLDSGCDAEFVLAGDGPMERSLRRYAARLGLNERLAFATQLAAFDGVISTVDIYVRSAPFGTMGYTVLQAMAMGKPVVACASAGIVEVVENDETGILVPKQDAAALAGGILRLLEEPGLLARMGAAARERVGACFNMEAMVERTLAVYEDVLEKSPQ